MLRCSESNFTGGFSCFPVHHWGPFMVSSAWSRKLIPGLRHPVLSATVSQFNVSLKKRGLGTSLVVQWLRLCSQCRGPRFDPWSDNQILHATAKKSHMLQRLQKIPRVATKPWHNQINIKEEREEACLQPCCSVTRNWDFFH